MHCSMPWSASQSSVWVELPGEFTKGRNLSLPWVAAANRPGARWNKRGGRGGEACNTVIFSFSWMQWGSNFVLPHTPTREPATHGLRPRKSSARINSSSIKLFLGCLSQRQICVKPTCLVWCPSGYLIAASVSHFKLFINMSISCFTKLIPSHFPHVYTAWKFQVRFQSISPFISPWHI